MKMFTQFLFVVAIVCFVAMIILISIGEAHLYNMLSPMCVVVTTWIAASYYQD